MDDFNPHEFIRQCAAHPDEKAPTFTVAQFLETRAHIAECPECADACAKAAADAPPSEPFSTN